jgi:hypothetical protein
MAGHFAKRLKATRAERRLSAPLERNHPTMLVVFSGQRRPPPLEPRPAVAFQVEQRAHERGPRLGIAGHSLAGRFGGLTGAARHAASAA